MWIWNGKIPRPDDPWGLLCAFAWGWFGTWILFTLFALAISPFLNWLAGYGFVWIWE